MFVGKGRDLTYINMYPPTPLYDYYILIHCYCCYEYNIQIMHIYNSHIHIYISKITAT